MKPDFSLSIPTPCTEKWSSFTPAASGGFCATCSKTVIDFTKMSDVEVIAYFKNKAAHTCGRFRADQLKMYAALTPARVNPGIGLLKAGFVSLLLLLASKQGTTQIVTAKAKTETIHHLLGRVQQSVQPPASDQLVKGIVKSSEDGLPLPGVNIALKGSAIGVISDEEGHFQFPERLKKGDVLVFSFIGLITQEYRIPEKSEQDTFITMRMETYPMVVMGAVAADNLYTEHPSGLSKLWSRIRKLF